jgi:hypothetical protein
MKWIFSLLAISLAANYILASSLARQKSKQQHALSNATVRSRTIPQAVASTASTQAPSNGTASADPRTRFDILRKAGFPEPFVREMVHWEIEDFTNPERLSLMRDVANVPFWKSPDKTEARRRLRQIELEKESELRTAFGGRPFPIPTDNLREARRFAFLPAEKMEAVSAIERDYREMTFQIQRERGAKPTTAEERVEKLRLLEREKREDLAKVMSPAELEHYDLQLSRSASRLRAAMSAFQPTEEEYRALYAARRAFDETQGGGQVAGFSSSRAAEAKFREEMRVILGEVRFNEFARAQDSGYRAATEIVRYFNLPQERAIQAYEVGQALQKRATAVGAKNGATPAMSSAELQDLIREANDKLGGLLTQPGLDAYKKTAGAWLLELEAKRVQ